MSIMLRFGRSVTIGLVMLLGASACGKRLVPTSANVDADPLSGSSAKLGVTAFKCQAKLKQMWFVQEDKTLELKTAASQSVLTHESPLEVEDKQFQDATHGLTESPNIAYVHLRMHAATESEIGCVDGQWSIHFASTTAIISLSRNVTSDSAYCWNPRGKSLQVSQSLSFGPTRRDIGAPIQQEADAKTFSGDVEATPVEYQILCTR